MRILCLDVGSSSLKFAIHELTENAEHLVAEGAAEDIGERGRFVLRTDRAPAAESMVRWRDTTAALDHALNALGEAGLDRFHGVGHRIVFGGPKYGAPHRVEASVLRDLRDLIPFDRVHLPAQLEAIRCVQRRYPRVQQVVCFDSAFHHAMPDVAKRYPLPRELDPPLRRYGFHGLSYEYVVAALPEARRGRVVIAHLGNGASLCAIRDGRPLDTTMGFSPLGGLMMGTRPGDLDPGVFLFCLERGWRRERIARLFNKDSGLAAISELGSDMRMLLERAPSDERAAAAVELFIYQARKHLGSMVAVLGGIDTLIFTGGIGEHAPSIRWGTCASFEHVGLQVDRGRNDAGDPIISTDASRVLVRTVQTNENLMIARHARALLRC